MTTTRLAPLAAALLLAAGCGGSSAPAPGPTHAVSVTVSGLAGAGLTLHLGPATPGQDLAVSADGEVQFPGKLAEGVAYAVTVKTQPTSPWQDCAVEGGSAGGGAGTMGTVDAAVSVTCTTKTFTVGGTVTGLTGPGLSLRLNGGAALPVDVDGEFTFPAVPSGTGYVVTVATHPQSPRQACQVVEPTGAGTVEDQAVKSVEVSCRSDVHTVGGTVADRRGDGLLLRLQVGGVTWSDDLPVTSDRFAFPAPVPEGEGWTVTVSQQPTVPWQTCDVAGGAGVMGSADVTTVAVTCVTRTFAVGGHALGVLQAGLSVSLSVPGAPVETVSHGGDGSFSFSTRVPSGQAFLVQVEASPPTQACAVTAPADVAAGTAVMAGAAVDVTVTCGCAPGRASCSQVTQDGCETPVFDDPANCGACGQDCDVLLPNTTATACQLGQCRVVTCGGGFDDCGAGAGCETPVSADPANCGACGHACPARPNAAPGCAGGVCGLAGCDPGFGDCDGQAITGCEVNLSFSAAHCGRCGNACPVPDHATPGCEASQCGIGACEPGFGNCDGLSGNGCEANFGTDRNNCGTCGKACGDVTASGKCVASTCAVDTCVGGWVDCDGDATNYCEAPVDHDPLNCGACGVVCTAKPNGTPGCAASACVMEACDPGYGDCDHLFATGCERQTTDDPQNCGGCGNACVSDRVCSAGSCQLAGSCRELLLQRPGSASGPYTLDPDGAGPGGPVQVYCDMTTDGGGWTFFAHVNGDYQAGRLFEVDLGTYDPARGDGNASYGRGGSVYQHLGATEIMVTVDVVDTLAARNGDRFVVYQFAPGAPAFDTGPVPSLAPGALFKYRTHFDPFADGIIEPNFFEDVWAPYTAEPDFIQGGWLPVAPLTILYGTTGLGTYWGSGMAPPGTLGVDTTGHDSWWYAR